MHVHCEKTSLYTTFWLTRKCSHENVLIEAGVCIQLVTQFPMLCSTDMFPRSASTTRRIHARVRTLKHGCLYTFWLTKSCLCIILNISHLVCYIISHICNGNKVQHHNFLTYEPFSLCNCDSQGRPRAQIVTLEDVPVCNLPHNFLCFISATMFPRSVLTTRRVHVHVRTLRDGCVHTFLTYELMTTRNFKHITPCL